MNRCQWPDGMEIRPDGMHRLDPCLYEVVEEHHGVTVRVLRCRRCGHQEIEWEDTGRWIPVSERLPDYNQLVLVTGSLGVIFTAYYSYPFGAFDSCWVDGEGWKLTAPPVAWMPLPEPYREEDEA